MRTKDSYIWFTLFTFLLIFLVCSCLFLSLWAKTTVDSSKAFTPSSSISVTVLVTDEDVISQIPEVYSLSQNYPNPFNPETAITYDLPKSCYVQLTVYNVLGQKVKTIINQHQDAGCKMVYWNGKDDKGNKVASGVYFYRIETPKYSETRKMILMR